MLAACDAIFGGTEQAAWACLHTQLHSSSTTHKCPLPHLMRVPVGRAHLVAQRINSNKHCPYTFSNSTALAFCCWPALTGAAPLLPAAAWLAPGAGGRGQQPGSDRAAAARAACAGVPPPAAAVPRLLSRPDPVHPAAAPEHSPGAGLCDKGAGVLCKEGGYLWCLRIWVTCQGVGSFGWQHCVSAALVSMACRGGEAAGAPGSC